MAHEHAEPISKIEKVSKVVDEVQAIGQENLSEEPNPETFSKLLAEKTQEAQAVAQREVESAKKPTPIEAMDNTQRRVIHRKDDEFSGLIADVDQNIGKIETLKEQLSTQKIDISRPMRSSMQRSLIHTDAALKIALSKVGVDYTPPTAQAPGLVAPVQKFLGYLSNSQEQLETLGTTLSNLHADDKSITPANMLALQMKMGVITQQIEFFSSLLNKSLESTKTIMNVQV